jgi:lysophospholipase L1-like esterase
MRSTQPPGALRFLALGDSYTIGEAVAEHERWPVRLAAKLRDRGIEVADPVIVAKTGWTTDELSLGIDVASPEGTFDLVTLLIGVNNQYRGGSTAEYREQFRALVERAVTFAGGRRERVVVLSIPDWGVTPFAAGRDRAQIAADIDAFNVVNRDEAVQRGCQYVDVTPVSRNAGADASVVATDGLHPSGAMYAAWADLALPAALFALGRT